MSSLRLKLSHISSKKVPAISLVAVAVVGMIIGVFAAAITVTQNPFNGQTGTFTNNTGNIATTDNGLSIVTNVPGTTNSTATFLPSGNKPVYYTSPAFVVGHWMESVLLTDNIATDSAAHTVKIAINSGATVPNGSALITTAQLTLTGSAGTSGGTITVYLDLGVTTITAPMSVYVTST